MTKSKTKIEDSNTFKNTKIKGHPRPKDSKMKWNVVWFLPRN